jgi:hypothetical protein
MPVSWFGIGNGLKIRKPNYVTATGFVSVADQNFPGSVAVTS